MKNVFALAIVRLFLFIGEWVSTLGRAYTPSVLITAALFGFPTDYIVTHEAACNLAKNEAEKNDILDNTLPKMLVGGFATVSVASITIASISLKLL